MLSEVRDRVDFEVYECPWLSETEFSSSRDFWMSNSRALHTEHSRVDNPTFSKLLSSKGLTLTTLHLQLSLLAPLHTSFWTQIRPGTEFAEHVRLDEAPDEKWARAESAAFEILRKSGFRVLSTEELFERVDWIDPGESFAAAEGLTVYTCLFREVG